MRKIKRRKLRKNFLPRITLFVFLLSSICFLGSSIFIRSYNNCLSTSLQSIQQKIEAQTLENNDVENQVNQLSSSLRIQAMTENIVSYNAQNIVSIK